MKNSIIFSLAVLAITYASGQTQDGLTEFKAFNGTNSNRIIIRNTFVLSDPTSSDEMINVHKGVVVKYLEDYDRDFAKVELYTNGKSLKSGYIRKSDMVKCEDDLWQKVKVHGRTGWFYIDDGS